jgi:hypothetical protein
LGFALSNYTGKDRSSDMDEEILEINIRPLQREQFAASLIRDSLEANHEWKRAQVCWRIRWSGSGPRISH